MKIGFVCSYLTVFTGGGVFLRDYANKLCSLGHYITIFVQKIDRSYYKFNSMIKIVEIGGYIPSNPLHWIQFNTMVKKYVQALDAFKGELLISLNFFSSKVLRCAEGMPVHAQAPIATKYLQFFLISLSLFASLSVAIAIPV